MSEALGSIREASLSRRRTPALLVAGALATALLVLVPIGFLVAQALSVGFGAAARLLVRPLVGELLVNTLLLTIAATAAASVLGVAVAWCVERSDLPLRRLWAVLAALPLAVPAFVTSYGWVSLTPAVQGFGGALGIVTLSHYALVYLPVSAMLRRGDRTPEESARSLGHSRFRTFLRVTLPQTRPALLGGALLVAVHLLAEFGAFSMLQFRTFTTVIYDQYRLGFDTAAASMLATVLVALCAIVLALELRVRGRMPHVRVGLGPPRPAERQALGRATPLVLFAFAALIGVALAVPLATLGYWLLRGSSAGFPAADLLDATTRSLELGLGAAALTTALALPVAILAVRYPSRLATLLERGTYVSYALPGIVVALALITISVRRLPLLYQTTTLLLVAYSVLFLPLAVVSVRAAMAQAPPALEEAARSLGCRPAGALRRVTLPLVLPGLGAAAALVFLSTMTELTATLLLAPIGTQTLTTQFWAATSGLAFASAAPYAALIVILSAPAVYLLTRQLGREQALATD